MTKLYYSPSQNGFYSDALHTILPDDAVEVSTADHIMLMNAQATGQRIVPGSDGRPILQSIETVVSFDKLKLCSKIEIDAAAEAERLKYITPGTGQAMTYQQKVAEAQAYKAATKPKPEDYPILVSEVGITAPTLSEVADTVLAAYQQWQQIGAMIEAIRLGAKRDIDAAENEAAARAVVEGIVWPSI